MKNRIRILAALAFAICHLTSAIAQTGDLKINPNTGAIVGPVSAATFKSANSLLGTGGALGTPSSGTLTNCTGLPVSGITASTSTALRVGSLEIGHASDTTLARSSPGRLSIEGVNIVGTSTTDALTNKTYEGLSITSSFGTLTIGNAKTFTASNTLTLTGTDGSSVAFGTGGTVLYTSNAANPTASVGLTAVNGVATTYMRSDAAPALSQSIVPTWTGAHTFNAAIIYGTQSAAAWTTNGIAIKGASASYTDTSSLGTVATAYTSRFGGNMISATSGTTYTNYFSNYVSDPVAGSNVIMTNKWALGVDSFKAGTSNALTISTSGVLSATSPDFTTSVTTSSTSFTAWAGATTLLTLGGTGSSASVFAPSALDSTSSTTGAIRTSGGISAAKNLYVGSNVNIPATSSASVGGIRQNGVNVFHSYNASNLFFGEGSGNFTVGNSSGGNHNVGVGRFTGTSLTSGGSNVMMCYEAGNALTSGSNNVLLGYRAGRLITTGGSNIALGANALSDSSTNALDIMAIGEQSLRYTSGSRGTAMGVYSLNNATTGSDNTAVGWAAFNTITTGSDNVGIGASAGRSMAAGTGASQNTFIGSQAGYNASQSNGVSNSMALGYGAYTTASNQVVIGNSSVTATILKGSVTIGATGTAVAAIYSASATLDFPSIAANGGTQDLTVTVTGAATGDVVAIGLPAAPDAGVVFNAFVSGANTVKIRATNTTTAGAIDPASASYRVTVTQF